MTLLKLDISMSLARSRPSIIRSSSSPTTPASRCRSSGGTTFTFVTEGIETALEQARGAAGDKDVAVGGGASAAQQYLAAGLLDELQIHLVPVLLGDGVRLFDDHLTDSPGELRCTRVIESPRASPTSGMRS